jgi:uncharacterized damage-inducible protein DinB
MTNAYALLLLDYEEWATSEWVAALKGLPFEQEGIAILNHLVRAQFGWLKHVGGPSIPESADLVAIRAEALAGWRDRISEADLHETIANERQPGENYAQPLSGIFAHVMNHGTYHRGELRGLARAHQVDAFPETDLIRFLRLFPERAETM